MVIMLYIISEDSTSGFQFWSEFNKQALNGKATVMHSGGTGDETGGINKIVSKISGLLLTPADTLFVALDYQDYSAIQCIESITVDAKKRGYKGFYTKYACFEEVFLSFQFLLEWGQIEHDSKLVDIYQNTCKAIHTGCDRFDKVNKSKDITDFEVLSGKRFNTKAQFYSHLLDTITDGKRDLSGQSRPWFHITKSAVRQCWVEDCPYQKPYCIKCSCRLLSKEMNALKKLQMLHDCSVLKGATHSLFDLKLYT